MCEISELTVDVVHAKPVKRRDDEGGGDACDSGYHGGDDGDEGDGDIDDTASEKDNENFGCARVIGQLAVSSESRM